jgi:ATP-dependent protease HslVU (ClpYQ) peptidase subunit
MANTILHKRSSTAAAVPAAAQVTIGELVLNVADGKIYLKRTDGVIVTFVPGYVPGQGDSAPMWK